jgi:hypothetical protein
VATLVSRLRSDLGRDVIVGNNGMYKLGPGVTVDVFAVGELVDRAEREVTSNSARAFAAARQALQLLGSGRTLVKARDAPWTVSVRALPLSLARRACLTLASAALQLGDPTTSTARLWLNTVAGVTDISTAHRHAIAIRTFT